METANPYQQLGIPPSATQDEIKAAYKKLALAHHPDKNQTDDGGAKFKLVLEAYNMLKTPALRAKYDQSHVRPSARRSRYGTASTATSPPAGPRAREYARESANPSFDTFFKTAYEGFFPFSTTYRTTFDGFYRPRSGTSDSYNEARRQAEAAQQQAQAAADRYEMQQQFDRARARTEEAAKREVQRQAEQARRAAMKQAQQREAQQREAQQREAIRRGKEQLEQQQAAEKAKRARLMDDIKALAKSTGRLRHDGSINIQGLSGVSLVPDTKSLADLILTRDAFARLATQRRAAERASHRLKTSHERQRREEKEREQELAKARYKRQRQQSRDEREDEREEHATSPAAAPTSNGTRHFATGPTIVDLTGDDSETLPQEPSSDPVDGHSSANKPSDPSSDPVNDPTFGASSAQSSNGPSSEQSRPFSKRSHSPDSYNPKRQKKDPLTLDAESLGLPDDIPDQHRKKPKLWFERGGLQGQQRAVPEQDESATALYNEYTKTIEVSHQSLMQLAAQLQRLEPPSLDSFRAARVYGEEGKLVQEDMKAFQTQFEQSFEQLRASVGSIAEANKLLWDLVK